MYFVYLLLCSDGSLYTGISTDPCKRFLEHQAGKGGAYTRSHPPLKIIYTEKLPDKSSALKKEFEIKSWPRQKKIKILKLSL
jgi:putative endonuclease